MSVSATIDNQTGDPKEFQSATERVASRAETAVAAAVIATQIRAGTRAERIAYMISLANVAATQLADIFVSLFLDAVPLGLSRPEDDEARIFTVVSKIFDDLTIDPAPRLSRVARTEVATAARSGSRVAMINHEIERYRWVTDSDPCPICIALAAGTFPIDEVPKTHRNCTCIIVPAPTTKRRTRP